MPRERRASSRFLQHVTLWLLVTLAGLAAWRLAGSPVPDAVLGAFGVSPDNALIVRAGESIAAALEKASPGAIVLVEPGEYRERLTLKDHVRVESRVPRGATLRLPSEATEQDAAVMAVGVTNAELVGFRIVGDAATPLGTGILVRSAGVRLIDLEITGAARTAIDLGPGRDVVLQGSDIHDNPGAGLALRTNATPRVTHNVFSRNGASEQAASAVLFEPDARPVVQRNVFHGFDPAGITLLNDSSRAQLKNDNWFPDARPAPTSKPARGRGPGR